jgi:8-oxo-dGTP diphosphatase
MIPIEVATGLLVKDGKILMCRRREDKLYPLFWEFPGGKLEAGETPLQALQRELMEELMIVVTSAEVWFEDTMSYSNGLTYHVTFFLVREFEGEPVNTEFNAIDWFTASELDFIQQLSGNLNILEKIAEEGLPA